MTKLVEIRCGQCQVVFGVTQETLTHLKMSSQTFYCPFGHQRYFPQGESEADRLRREAERLRQEQARLQDEAQLAWRTAEAQRERAVSAERRAAAARGQVTKLKKRAAAGVCPCCNRQFQNLARHMATRHKGFVAEDAAPEGATLQ